MMNYDTALLVVVVGDVQTFSPVTPGVLSSGRRAARRAHDIEGRLVWNEKGREPSYMLQNHPGQKMSAGRGGFENMMLHELSSPRQKESREHKAKSHSGRVGIRVTQKAMIAEISKPGHLVADSYMK